MKRHRIASVMFGCALLGAVALADAQTELNNAQSQRIRELVASGQGVLLPLEGALDPLLPAAVVPSPPDEPEDDVAAMPQDDNVDAEPAPAVGDDAAPSDGQDPVAASVATETPDAPPPEAAGLIDEEAGETAEETQLPELDAIDGVVVAELGNPDSIGPWRLWLASYGTVREAQSGWQQLAKDNRDVLGDLLPVIVIKELGGDSGTFFRLQAGPLADEAVAEARCDTLKARSLYCAILGPQDG